MIKVSDSDMEFLKKNIDQAEEKLKNSEVNDLLQELDELIVYKGLGKDYSPNQFGREAQKVYDSIYSLN